MVFVRFSPVSLSTFPPLSEIEYLFILFYTLTPDLVSNGPSFSLTDGPDHGVGSSSPLVVLGPLFPVGTVKVLDRPSGLHIGSLVTTFSFLSFSLCVLQEWFVFPDTRLKSYPAVRVESDPSRPSVPPSGTSRDRSVVPFPCLLNLPTCVSVSQVLLLLRWIANNLWTGHGS